MFLVHVNNEALNLVLSISANFRELFCAHLSFSPSFSLCFLSPSVSPSVSLPPYLSYLILSSSSSPLSISTPPSFPCPLVAVS